MEESLQREMPYYRDDLALVHHLGFGFHADACAPDIISLLEPIRRRDGLVVEIGCGSGLLTAYLVDAGLRVVATDASEAMLRLARSHAPGAAEIRRLTLPNDPIPSVDAIVGVGHALNYLDEESQVDAALVAIAARFVPAASWRSISVTLNGEPSTESATQGLADRGLGVDNGVLGAPTEQVCAAHDYFRPTGGRFVATG